MTDAAGAAPMKKSLVRNPLFARYLNRFAARRYQRTADLIWPRLMGGCHVERRTEMAIGRVFTLERCRGFRFPPSAAFSPVAPRIIGVARKAETPSGDRPTAR